jgi:hypothetical protein
MIEKSNQNRFLASIALISQWMEVNGWKSMDGSQYLDTEPNTLQV